LPQGLPIACDLFRIYIHPLLHRLSRIDGVQCAVKRSSELAFADDINITSNNPKALQEALDVLSEWCEVTGMEVNFKEDKSKTAWSGQVWTGKCFKNSK
jgi:hypothetical protein